MVEKNGSESTVLLHGRYELGRLLGHGTFAKVYNARNVQTGKNVAMKVVGKEKVVKVGMVDQIKREISVMRMVKHPNIVELHEVMASKSKIYFAMELVRGGELFAKVAKGRLREDVARVYFKQLISAVDFCHSRGVSHRDLKPENLLVDDNGDLKISDFGLSALPEQILHDGLLHTQCGTPAYVAPEVLRRKGYDGAKADIWSCGVVLYVLLAGSLPFQDENLMNMYRKIFKADFNFPPWFSPESRRLISKLLVVDPDRRISIPAIMRTPWLRKNLTPPLTLKNDEPSNNNNENVDWEETELISPKFLNAFEFISSMSSGFDLSSLFESKRKLQSVFMSRSSATEIMEKIETVTKEMDMKVKKTKDFKVKMEGKAEGRKGRVSMTAEVFEVAPEIAVVEFCKSAGDTLEYNRLYEEEVRPALSEIVWS